MNGSLKLYDESGRVVYNGAANGGVDTSAMKLPAGKYWGDFGFPLVEPVLTVPVMPATPPAAVSNCPVLAFHDTFNPGPWPAIANQISNHGPIAGPVRWVAHPPYGSDFTDGGFFGDVWNMGVNPPVPWGNGGPYSTDNGYLEINAFTVSDGSWRCGLLSSVDSKGAGFSASAPSYWECCKWCPALKWNDAPNTPGMWPAFWLDGVNGIAGAPSFGGDAAEIDIIEAYSIDYTKFHQNWHTWNGGRQVAAWGNMVDAGVDLSAGWHTFGIWINSDLTHWFFDRAETWTYPTQPSQLLPLYCMINFAQGGGFPVNVIRQNNYKMRVAYVACWTH